MKTGAKGTDRSLYAAVVSEEYFLEMDGWNNFSPAVMLRVNLDANSGDVKNLISEIAADAGCKAAPSYNEAYLNLSQPSALMVMAAAAGLVVIVRRRKFSLMRSVGMSQKQLSVMVHKEGLIVVGMGLVLSVIIGGGIGYVLCSFLKNSLMNYLNYQFPFSITILNCAVIILCSVVITTGALKRQSKLSMMETLR